MVITDVDGVLRDVDTHSLADAQPALEALASEGSPVVLCSDQSAAELLWLQRALGLHHPFICEGGAALWVPQGYFCELPPLGSGEWELIEFGRPRDQVRAALECVTASLHVPALLMGDLSVEEVAHECGLSVHEAQLATRRQYSELFRLLDVTERTRARVFTAMREAGCRCVAGSRVHLATGVSTLAHAVRLLVSLYRARNEPPVIIGMGGDWRDRSLLREVDAPVIVRNQSLDQARLLRKVPSAYLTDAPGPAGWTEAILGHCSVGRA